MKKIQFIFLLLTGLAASGFAQNRLNLGAGYFGQNITSPGATLQLEFEQSIHEGLSLPLRMEAGFYNYHNDYNVLTIDLNRGFRKYLSNGLFVEQTFGAGVMLSYYRDHLWHEDEHRKVTYFSKAPVIDFMPSATLGGGFNFSSKASASNILWVRTKISWQLFSRELSMPFFGLMVGFTHTFKTFKNQ